MSFSADWLALRAGFDAAARSTELEARLAAWARGRTAATGRPLTVVDLGGGTGNNRRHLAPRLPVPQSWTIVDSDAGLLAAAADPSAGVAARELDLVRELEAAVPDRSDLVTASALLDLVSQDWLERLLARVEAAGAALLVVLTYDGRIAWEPADDLDAMIRDLVNRHQRGDKGFGPALGPEAGPALRRLAGGRLAQARSDWSIGPEHAAMRRALVDGWAEAAAEAEPAAAGAVETWRRRTRDRPARIVVGHLDQLLIPPA